MRCVHGYCGTGFDRHCCPAPANYVPVGYIICGVGVFLIIVLVVGLFCCYRKRPELFTKCLQSYQRATPPQTVTVAHAVHTSVTTHVHHHPQSMVYYPTTTSNTSYTMFSTNGNQCHYSTGPQPPQEVKTVPNPPGSTASPPSYEAANRLLT